MAAQPAPRPTEEIRADLAKASDQSLGALADWPQTSCRLADDVEPLLDRLAVVDRECADLRAENERLMDLVTRMSAHAPDWLVALAALSAAPQPEPITELAGLHQSWCNEPKCAGPCNCQPEPPASDEPTPVPDLMMALRASVEAAKERRTASDEPARCEHGKTEVHPREDSDQDHMRWCIPGPAASGTPDPGSSTPWGDLLGRDLSVDGEQR